MATTVSQEVLTDCRTPNSQVKLQSVVHPSFKEISCTVELG